MKRTQDPPLRFVLIVVFVLLIEGVINAMFSLGAKPFAVTIVLAYVAYAVYAIKIRDHTLWLWLIFGFFTGLTELASNCDYFLVEEMKVLIYPSDFPKIGVTPAYLRFGWGLIFTTLGLIGLYIRKRSPTSVEATLLTAALGAILISVFENLARQAGWWYYQKTPMLIWTPYFVNVFEFLSTLVIVPVGWWIVSSPTKRAYFWAVGFGIAMGIWMCIAMRIAYWFLGSCDRSILQLPCTPPNLPVPWGPLG